MADLDRRATIVTGAVGGVLAFLAGYAVTYALRAGDLLTAFEDGSLLSADGVGLAGEALQESAMETPGKAELANWLYLDLHHVAFSGTYAAGPPDRARSYEVVLSRSPDGVLLALPVAVLVAAGFAVGRRLGVDGSGHTDLQAAVAGASVAVGYVALSAATAVLFAWDDAATLRGMTGGPVEISFGPELASTVLLAGLAYPLVFGGVGGYLARALAD